MLQSQPQLPSHSRVCPCPDTDKHGLRVYACLAESSLENLSTRWEIGGSPLSVRPNTYKHAVRVYPCLDTDKHAHACFESLIVAGTVPESFSIFIAFNDVNKWSEQDCIDQEEEDQ